MDAAKQAISGFLSRGGQEHTDVEEGVNPAVTSETIKPHRHEETTEAVDREVHQHHYHTTVQPISHTETIPEKHTHNLAPQVEKTIHHGNEEQDRARVAADLGQFRDASTTIDTTHSQAAAPRAVGEHVHHHVHETVQPIIHKETIQPEFVHTTIPVHEKHLAPSEHHGLSTLPVKTMDEFKELGQTISGGNKSHHEYEGHPRPYNQDFQARPAPIDRHQSEHMGTHDPVATGHFDYYKQGDGRGAGVPGSNATGSRGLGNDSHDHTGRTHGSGLATGAAAAGATGAGIAAAEHHGHHHGHHHGTGTGTGTGIGTGTGTGTGTGVGSGVGSGAAAAGATGAGLAAAEHHGHHHGHHGTGTGTGTGVGSGVVPESDLISGTDIRHGGSGVGSNTGVGGIGSGLGSGTGTGVGHRGLNTSGGEFGTGPVDPSSYQGTGGTHGSGHPGLATGAALGATAAGTAMAAEHHHDRGLGTSGTGTNTAGSNFGGATGLGSGSTDPSYVTGTRGTHDAAFPTGATTAAGAASGPSRASAGYPDQNFGSTLGTTNRMAEPNSQLGHEGTSTTAIPSRTIDSDAARSTGIGTGVNAGEFRDTYDEQAARPPVTSSHGGHMGTTAAGATAAGVGAGAVASEFASGSHAATKSGRKTKHGYTTSADLDANYGKTKFGYLTGSGGKRGLQDGATSSTTEHSHHGAAEGAAATGAAATGASAAATHHAATHHGTSDTRSPAETQGSKREGDEEPENYEGGKASRTDEPKKDIKTDDNVQHASKQGDDPNLVETKGKWTGTGEPGSHSAVFGLTPDGKTYDDTGKQGSGTTKLKETPQEQENRRETEGQAEGDTGSRKDTQRAEVAEQMHDPKVAEKGHGGKAEYDNDGNKPGAGVPT